MPPGGDVEAEYHQPPRPATGAIGDTITLTGTNIGVRLDTTVTGLVDPAEASRPPRRREALRRRRPAAATARGSPSTTAALESARLRYDGGAAEPVLGVKADCSNGFEDVVRIDVGLKARGCLLFQVPDLRAPASVPARTRAGAGRGRRPLEAALMWRNLNLCLVKHRGYRGLMGGMFRRVLGLWLVCAAVLLAPSVAAAAPTRERRAAGASPAAGELDADRAGDARPVTAGERRTATLGGELLGTEGRSGRSVPSARPRSC